MPVVDGESCELVGRLYPEGRPARVIVMDGIIREVRALPALTESPGTQRWITPGFFDLQVNGFAGRNFIDMHPGAGDPRHIAEAVLRTGVTRFLPTVITAGMETLCRQLSVIADAIESDPLVRQMCPGAHVEGPFLNPEDGPRGAHPREHVRPPSIEDFDRLYAAARGHVALLTLAADQPGSVELIRHAAGRGVPVSIGHHRPSLQDIETAVKAGARLCTHLGNGSDAMLPRHSNYVWYQLGDDRLWATFIADGQHLPPATLRCMLRAKGIERSILITDAMGAAGLPPGRYPLGQIEVERTPEGRVVLPGTPYQAGSAAEMPLVISCAVRNGGVSFQEAVALASLRPHELLFGRSAAWACTPGARADCVEITWAPSEHRLTPHRSVIGRFAWTAE